MASTFGSGCMDNKFHIRHGSGLDASRSLTPGPRFLLLASRRVQEEYLGVYQ